MQLCMWSFRRCTTDGATHIEIHRENISRLTIRGRHVQTIILVVSSQQRYRRHKSVAPACSGYGGPPHDDWRMCKAWNRVCYKCQKLNHFAKVCKANIQQTHLVENDTHSQSSDKLCALGLYHTGATHTIPPYICNVQIEGSDMVLEIDTGLSVSLITGVEWAKCARNLSSLSTRITF